MSAFRCNEFLYFYIILVSLFGFLISETEEAAYPGSYLFECNMTSNRTNPEFHANLDSLLSSLTSEAATHNEDGFYKDVKGWGTPDIINGQYICFGNFNASVCEDCVKATTKRIRSCINGTEVIIWYDDCILLYQNRSYTFDDMYNDGSASFLMINSNISGSKMERERFNDLVGKLLNELAPKAVNSQSRKFATGQSNFSEGKRIYSLVQCVPDLNTSRCQTYLTTAISKISICCSGRIGVRFLVRGCNIRFELYRFYYEIMPNLTQPPIAAVDPPTSDEI